MNTKNWIETASVVYITHILCIYLFIHLFIYLFIYLSNFVYCKSLMGSVPLMNICCELDM